MATLVYRDMSRNYYIYRDRILLLEYGTRSLQGLSCGAYAMQIALGKSSLLFSGSY